MPNWKAIERAFCKGDESLRAIARQHGVSDAAIRKRAKSRGWPPRPSANCEPKCEPDGAVDGITAAGGEEPEQRVETAADLVPEVVRILELQLEELRLVSGNVALLRRIISEETRGDRSPKRRQLMERVLSIPVRALAAKNLASALSSIRGVLTQNPPPRPLGKKEGRQAAAEEYAASGGIFAPPPPPGVGKKEHEANLAAEPPEDPEWRELLQGREKWMHS